MITGRHRPRLGVASGQHLASPSGIARGGLGRLWQWVGRELGLQRIPTVW